jgi:hypothetical protein
MEPQIAVLRFLGPSGDEKPGAEERPSLLSRAAAKFARRK